MAGNLLLCGGEFQKGQEQADLFALQKAGGKEAFVVILTAGNNGLSEATAGLNWYRSLGAANVEALTLLNAAEAARPDLAAKLARANLIYLADGPTALWWEVLQNSRAWAALKEAFSNGAMLAASGGGGMVVMENFYDPAANNIQAGLGLFSNTIFVPRFNGPGRKWAPQIQKLLPQALLIGIDEKVAIGGKNNDWQVYGRGWVTIYRGGKPYKYQGGQPFKMFP